MWLANREEDAGNGKYGDDVFVWWDKHGTEDRRNNKASQSGWYTYNCSIPGICEFNLSFDQRSKHPWARPCRAGPQPYRLAVDNCSSGLPLTVFANSGAAQPFVSPSIITGQLASLWFSRPAMGASQGAASDVLRALATPREFFLELRFVRGQNDVNAWAPPSPPCVSVMMTPLFLRFKSIKSDEAKEKEAAHRAAWLPHHSIWTHPFQMSHSFPGHSLTLPRRGQRRRILLMISASWTFVNEQWKTEQCLNNSERTDALDRVHSSLWWRHYMSLTVIHLVLATGTMEWAAA